MYARREHHDRRLYETKKKSKHLSLEKEALGAFEDGQRNRVQELQPKTKFLLVSLTGTDNVLPILCQ